MGMTNSIPDPSSGYSDQPGLFVLSLLEFQMLSGKTEK